MIAGPGEAGKSTLIKQMQLIHGEELDDAEKLQKIPYIRQNIFDSIVVSVHSCLHFPASFIQESITHHGFFAGNSGRYEDDGY